MSRTKIVVDMLERVRVKQISQEETKAIVEALILAITVDGDVAGDELETLKSASHLLNWRGPGTVSGYAAEYVDRLSVARVDVESEMGDLVQGVAERLQSDWIREEAYYLVYRISAADSVVHYAETNLLVAFADALHLTPEQRKAVEARVEDTADDTE